MTKQVLDIVGFLKLVLDALKAAHVDYLIGGAIAHRRMYLGPRGIHDEISVSSLGCADFRVR